MLSSVGGGGASSGPTVRFLNVMRWTCAFGFVSILLGNAPVVSRRNFELIDLFVFQCFVY